MTPEEYEAAVQVVTKALGGDRNKAEIAMAALDGYMDENEFVYYRP